MSRGSGQGALGVVVRHNYSVDISRGERDKRAADVLHLLGKDGYKVISFDGGRKGRGRGEEGREDGKQFSVVGGRGVADLAVDTTEAKSERR